MIPQQTALLVVDMQHGFLDPGASLEVPKGRDAVPNIASLIEACREFNLRVAFTEFVTEYPPLTGRTLPWWNPWQATRTPILSPKN